MKRLCKKCRQLVPSELYERHRQAHHNAEKPRQPTAEWWRIRRRVLKVKGAHCWRCGRTQTELTRARVSLHIHHLDGNPANNSMRNLEPRCSDCHPRGGDQPY